MACHADRIAPARLRQMLETPPIDSPTRFEATLDDRIDMLLG
jgi:hypothetical protein